MNYFEEILDELGKQDNLRALRTTRSDGKYIWIDGKRYLNMSSNDYLGLAADTALQNAFMQQLDFGQRFLMSNSASRLMTGNSPDYYELEAAIAVLYPAGRVCTVLGTGFAANSALLQAIASPDDLIVADKASHASIADGLRLSPCRWERYRHNDMDHLESILKKAQTLSYRTTWVVTESLFSMDGDRAPLGELLGLKEKYGVKLILDEAHAFGVYGRDGSGLADQAGVAEQIDIIVGTLGKAAASCGGFILTDELTRQVLVNRMRTLIFSTALAPISLLWSRFVIDRLPSFDDQRRNLEELIEMMTPSVVNASQIIPVLTYENRAAIELSEKLREAGYWVTPIRYPTVPKGRACIRLSLTAAMTREDIAGFRSTLERLRLK